MIELLRLKKIIEYPDRRIKAIVCTMVSSGIRVGAWDFLKWKHIVPIERNGLVIAAKIIVYAGEEDEHFSFITPEAYHELDKWKEYRIHAGEQVTDESWVVRNIWNTKKGYTRGLITAPIRLQSEGVKRLVEDALWTQGLRKKLEQGKKRHEFQTDHGFRKFFETRCVLSGMNSKNVDKLMNHSHSPRVSGSYYRVTVNELLEDYLKAIDELTIMDDHRLFNRISEIGRKNNQSDSLLMTELRKKEVEIKKINEQIQVMQQSQEKLLDVLFEREVMNNFDRLGYKWKIIENDRNKGN
jgi:integrase